MAPTRLLSRRCRTVTYLLLGVAVPPAVTLVWLGLQLLQQERSLLAQRLVALDEGFSLSPDGRPIAFLSGKSAAEVWALENFLPPALTVRR